MISNIAKSHINEINPYWTIWDSIEEGVISAVRTTRLYGPSDSEDTPILTDRVIDFASALPFTNYEKQIVRAGTVARTLDWGVFGIVGGLQGIVIIDELFKVHFLHYGALNYIPSTLKLLAKPLSSFFFGMGIIEGVFESINLSRVTKLLYRFENDQKTSLSHLQWIKKHYFTLQKHQVKKISDYIEKKHPEFTKREKKAYFDQIAHSALKIKYERLARRITSGLAKGVHQEIDGIINGLQSSFSSTRANAQKRAQKLLQSVTQQVKNKIILHILALMSIACTVTSMIGVFVGVSTGTFFILLGTAAIVLMAIQFLGKKKLLDNEVNRFYETFREC